MEIPIIIKLLTSLAVIIIANKLFSNLSVSLLLGSAVFAFWTGQNFSGILRIGAARISSWNTVALLLLVSLVITLSGQMNKTGLIPILVQNIRSRISTKTSMALLPAIIGLLPMPGGALFSAPILDSFDGTEGVSQESKARINYWFRHIWEYAWPLYPGVIVASDIAGLDLWVFMIAGLPMSAAAVLFGYIFYLKKIPGRHNAKDFSHRISQKPFIPIITVIVVYAGIQVLFPQLSELNQYIPMLISLSASILLLQYLSPVGRSDWKELILSRRLLNMVLIILMVRLYGAYIEADIDGMSIVQNMTQEMAQLGIPSLPLIMILPFIAGLTMGVSVGYAGAALPVVVALLGVDPSFPVLIAHVMLAYVCGFMGTMLSPLHVCGIVSCQYYKTSFNKVLLSVIPPAVLMTAAGYIYSRLIVIML